MKGSITISIEYANGESWNCHSPDILRALLDAVKNNLQDLDIPSHDLMLLVIKNVEDKL